MKTWVNSLLKDSLVYGLGYGVSRFLQIIILPIITKALTVPEFGYYSNYVIFYTIIAGFFVLGLDTAVSRFFFDSDDKKYHQRIFSSALFFILGLSIIAVCGFFLSSDILMGAIDVPVEYKGSLRYVLFSIPAITLNNFFLSWFKWKRQKFNFLTNSAGSVFLLLIPLLLIPSITFEDIFRIIFFSQLLVAVISTILSAGYLRFYFDRELLLSLLKYGFPWMLVFVFGISRTYLDRMFLSGYLNDEEYGIYNFSVRISTIISLVITAFDMSFGPLAFSIWKKAEAPVFFARLQTVYVLLISAFACLISIASPIIIQLLGGAKYIGAEKVLPILLFAAIPLSLVNFSNLGTAYAKKSLQSTLGLFLGFIAVLVFNLVLTPVYLQYGAGISSLVGHMLMLIAGYIFSARHYKIPFNYVSDLLIMVFFFLASVLFMHLPFSKTPYLNILIQVGVLIVVICMAYMFFIPGSYRKSLKNLQA